MKRYLLFGAIVVALVAVTLVAFFLKPKVDVEVAIAKRQAIQGVVDQQAKTRLPRVHKITMPFGGRIDEITLTEGDSVTKDQVVAQISQADLGNEVAEAQAVVDRLAEAIRENRDTAIELSSRQQAMNFVESMVKTVAAADARKDSGKSKMDYSESHLSRMRELSETRTIPEDELERAELDFEQSRFNFRQDNLVAESIRAIEAATKLLPKMVDDYIARKAIKTEVLIKQKAEAEARLRQVLIKQQRSVMHSPIDGIVLEVDKINEQFVSPGSELLILGDLNQMEIEAELLTMDTADVRTGNAVQIYGAGISTDLALTGTVKRINPAGFTKISSLGVEQQRVKVVIELLTESRAALLNAGMGVDYRLRVRIITNENPDAVTISRACLFRGPDNAWQVYVVRNGRVELQTVEVGIMNNEIVEIITGVMPGDNIVLAPDNQVKPGARVNVVN